MHTEDAPIYIAMESESDMSSVFSKLNVNAVEFVPSFSSPSAAPTTADTEAEMNDTSDTQKMVVEQPKNNGTCKSEREICVKFPRRDGRRLSHFFPFAVLQHMNEVTQKRKKSFFLPHRTVSVSRSAGILCVCES